MNMYLEMKMNKYSRNTRLSSGAYIRSLHNPGDSKWTNVQVYDSIRESLGQRKKQTLIEIDNPLGDTMQLGLNLRSVDY